nr:L-glutamate gamma-semialdehyde dehydrogenase [Ardenticatena sp.]
MRLQEVPPFRNEPLTDFSKPENRAAMEAALEKVRAQFDRHYPLIIGDDEIYLDETIASLNPSHPDQVVGRVSAATADHAARAVEVAYEAFQTWRKTPAEERAAILLKAAQLMRERKHEFSAWMIYEVGKSWPEADADTAEAIDFLEYYARQMLDIEERAPKLVYQIPTERSTYRYIPLGVGAIITPWNFPVAIFTGMVSSALVTGNTVVAKPAEQSPVVAYHVVQLLYEAGIPRGVLNYLPGYGEVAGEALVAHPKTRFISFTGSKEVGIHINQRAAEIQPGQIWLKRTVLEMGGKDAVIVDETADLDAATEGVVVSAFGFQGQKCSAGSRAIFVEEIYDEMVQRVVERTKQLKIGDPVDPTVFLGPVIDTDAVNKIMSYIEIGYDEGNLVLGGKRLDLEGGYFIEPTIFTDVPWDVRIAQEEIFGPVLSIIKAKDFDDALRIANSTEYGLTGSVYSRDRARLDRAADEFHVGNLYFNRKSTGALVGVHPFGGFNMSGTDSKAGGPDYLLLFLQPKSISEKIK